jgi:hypothetical protein
MLRNSVILVGFLFPVVLANACYSNRLTISVLEPASVTLPASVQRISILPLPGLFSKPDVFDSITYLTVDKGTDVKDIKMGYLHGIYDVLSISPRFQKVVMSDTSSTRFLSGGNLYWDDAERICAHDSTDVLLVLSKAVSNDYYDYFSEYEKQDILANSYILLNKTKWVFYLPEKQRALARFNFSDTIWLTGGFSNLEFEELLYQACYASGKSAGAKLCPHWNDTAKRMFYSGPGRKMRIAARFVIKNQWSDAASIWNKLANDPERTRASRAAYNLALAYERDDVLDQACLWITYSDSLSANKMTSAYKRILDARLKTKSTLDKQMAGN